MRLVDLVQHRTAVTERADASLRRRVERCIDEERASPLLGWRDSEGQLRRRSGRGELPERRRGEEARLGSLEFCDGVELRGRRFDGVLVMVVDGSTCLLLQRRSASVVEQNGSSAGVFRVDGIPRKTVTCVAPGSSAIESHGGNGMVMRMVACAWTRVVPAPSSSSASWIKNLSSGSALSMIRCTSAKVTVPVSLLWQVRQVRPLPPNVSFSKSFFPSSSIPSSSWPSSVREGLAATAERESYRDA